MSRLSAAASQALIPCLIGLLWLSFLATALPASAAPVSQSRKAGTEQVTATYINATLTEDTSWRGTIVVKGSVMVAPQATLRIEPGTVIRFTALKGTRPLPRLVVMGRIQSVGTAERPILFAPMTATSNRGDWGGVLLLSSEKRNQFEHCRIEGAETGLEGRFSSVTAKALAITRSQTGCLLRDCTATLISPNISACETGIMVYDSEVELRDGALAANRRGMDLQRSSVVMSAVVVSGCSQQAILSEDCRLKLSSCEISDNALGVRISGGEGQLFLSRFVRNRDIALHLSAARLKISRCQISHNMRDGVKLEDDRATLWGNAVTNNGGYNLVYSGQETVSAVQNWWGTSDESAIVAKLSAVSGAVNVFPWLIEKPVIFP